MKKLSLFLSLMLLTLSFAFGQQTEKPKIYNEEANPKTDIANAVKKASAEKKHVLLQIGGNWCAWCIMFDKLTKENQEIKDYMANNYEVVHVNYSPKNNFLSSIESVGFIFPERINDNSFLLFAAANLSISNSVSGSSSGTFAGFPFSSMATNV